MNSVLSTQIISDFESKKQYVINYQCFNGWNWGALYLLSGASHSYSANPAAELRSWSSTAKIGSAFLKSSLWIVSCKLCRWTLFLISVTTEIATNWLSLNYYSELTVQWLMSLGLFFSSILIEWLVQYLIPLTDQHQTNQRPYNPNTNSLTNTQQCWNLPWCLLALEEKGSFCKWKASLFPQIEMYWQLWSH